MNDRTKSNSQPLRSVQGVILKQKTPSLSTARNLAQFKDFDSLVKWATTAQRKGKYIFQDRLKALFPKTIARLKRDLILKDSNVMCEISWASSLIKSKSSQLKEFVQMSNNLELMYWKGDFDTCDLILRNIEEKFGVSLWLIEVKMAILQASKGLAAQKKYLAEIKKTAVKAVSYYGWNFSFRNEDSVTPSRYIKHVRNASPELKRSGQQTSILYKTLPTAVSNQRELQAILQFETNSSIIDLYSTFIELGVDFETSEPQELSEIKSKFNARLLEILPLTNDHRLINLLEPVTTPSTNSNWNFLIESFLSGKWKICLDLICSNEAFSNSPQTIEIEADCRIFLNATSTTEIKSKPRATILNALIDIRKNGSAAEKSLDYLFKLRLNLRRFDFSFIIDKWLDDVLHPWLANSRYSRLSIRTFSKDLSFDLFDHKPNPSWNQYFSLQIKLRSLSERRNFVEVINETNDWSALECLQTKKIVILHRQRALLEQKNYKTGIQEASLVLIEHPSLTTHIPINEYVKALDKDLRRELAGEISIPILLHIASKKLNKDLEKISAFAYEDFLLSQKYRKPSDLAENFGDHCQASLIYYLKNICTADIMKVSRVFKSTFDLQNERLLVCRMLIKLDHDNKDNYETEVREITRAQTIFEGVRHIEKSKISIDVSGLRRWAETNLNEDFNRLKELLLIEGESSRFYKSSGDNELINFVSSGTKKDELFFPDNESRYSLIELYWSLLMEFLFNSEYGLDCYLSMRIRHGVLSGQLRGALESYKIITKRSSDGKTYLSNKYWIKELSEQEFSKIEQVDEILTNFSRELDDLIHHLVSEKIQIVSPEKPEGWFREIFTSTDMRVLQEIVREDDMSFSNFFEASTHIFWRGIDICLKEINEHLELEIKKSATKIFERLNRSILNLQPDAPPLALIRAITEAKTSYFQSLNVVKEWFSLPSPYEPPVFSFEQLVRVGLECVKKIKPNFEPEIVIAGDNINITSMLTYFSDIFYVIFNNIEEYSDIERPKVTVSCNLLNDLLSIDIINEIAPSARDDSSVDRVEEAKELIKSGDYRKKVNEEDRSGFSKIKNLIGENNSLAFDFTDNSKFFVHFTTTFNRALT
ncbi:hypothetical protein [Pseudomonas brassicacearum]|uniref:hypothetical protein n=1 Tax=Pseudomonas brassicacearum TaxID=930166 RepID=UPI000AE6D3B1|nr:hypothetical protein [Pseudomonas brassicacearum]